MGPFLSNVDITKVRRNHEVTVAGLEGRINKQKPLEKGETCTLGAGKAGTHPTARASSVPHILFFLFDC